MIGSGGLEMSDKIKKNRYHSIKGMVKIKAQTTSGHHDNLFSRPFLLPIANSISLLVF